MTDYANMNNSGLVEAFNKMVETAGLRGIEVTQVKKFKSHSIGVERCQKLEERLIKNGVEFESSAPEETQAPPPEEREESDPNTDEVHGGPAEEVTEAESSEESEVIKKAAKKKAPAKKTVAKKRVAKAKVAKVAKPKFGFDKVIVEVGACNRFKGSKAEKLYGSMARYMERHPKATVAEVIENTDYRRQDYLWDLERKTIKVKSV